MYVCEHPPVGGVLTVAGFNGESYAVTVEFDADMPTFSKNFNEDIVFELPSLAPIKRVTINVPEEVGVFISDKYAPGAWMKCKWLPDRKPPEGVKEV